MPGTPARCACRCLKFFIFTSESQLAMQFTPLLIFLHTRPRLPGQPMTGTLVVI